MPNFKKIKETNLLVHYLANRASERSTLVGAILLVLAIILGEDLDNLLEQLASITSVVSILLMAVPTKREENIYNDNSN